MTQNVNDQIKDFIRQQIDQIYLLCPDVKGSVLQENRGSPQELVEVSGRIKFDFKRFVGKLDVKSADKLNNAI